MRKHNSENTVLVFICLSCLVAAFFFVSRVPATSLKINDYPAQYAYYFSKKQVNSLKIVGIAIDHYSIDKVSQRWPWKRSAYAELLEVLSKEKVKTIGFDLVFKGSEDEVDDLRFKDALSTATAHIILASTLDERGDSYVHILPLDIFKDSAYATGIINTVVDSDGLIRRAYGYKKTLGEIYLPFSLQLAASYLDRKPEQFLPLIPLLNDKTFYVNYIMKPKDIIRVSFYDVVNNLAKLKAIHGRDFLEGALVLVYPEAELIHDIHNTPIGRIPGGFVILNSVADMLLGRFLNEVDFLVFPFIILTALAVFYILINHCKFPLTFSSLLLLFTSGFGAGFILTLGVIFLNFFAHVFFNLKGIKFDFAFSAVFALLFFAVGSLYKYMSFFSQISQIKDQATLDPLRSLFNLRYFYYRLDLELKNKYILRDRFVIFIYFESLKEAIAKLSLEQAKALWRNIGKVFNSVDNSFWSVYSPDEVSGCVVGLPKRAPALANALKNSLEACLKENGLGLKVKVGLARYKKSYPPKEMLGVLSRELKKRSGQVVIFKDEDFAELANSVSLTTHDANSILDNFTEDIEERNQQLLNLFEELNKEYAHSKETFFQIITSLVNALEARDAYTEGHSTRVAEYALRVADKLGWSEEEKEKLKKAALLHDLGKIGVPDAILHKRSSLDDQEFTYMKKHSLMGAKILEPLKDLKDIVPWIMYHHEKWDGRGYPHGLSGSAIPIGAQIIAICDVFDALTTGRDYKVGFTYDFAIAELIKSKGTHFNPELVDVFVSAITSLPPNVPK